MIPELKCLQSLFEQASTCVKQDLISKQREFVKQVLMIAQGDGQT